MKNIQGYADIHSHIIPGIDDGARSMDMSIRMLQIARENGIRDMILTPHNKPMHRNPSPEKLKELTGQLQAEAQRNGIDINLYMGSELYYRSEAVELLDKNKVCTMAGSSYVLVEFNPMDDFDYIRNGLYQLIAGGYRPILAHTERYANICSSYANAEELAKMGSYIQVNSDSIMGEYSYQAKCFTRRMLKHRLVSFVATDAHNDTKRCPCLNECAKYIAKKYGEDYMEELLYHNPRSIIADEYI